MASRGERPRGRQPEVKRVQTLFGVCLRGVAARSFMSLSNKAKKETHRLTIPYTHILLLSNLWSCGSKRAGAA